MSYSNCSTSEFVRGFSASSGLLERLSTQPHDFITFLGVAQYFQVPLLPITWQPKLLDIGEGGHSVINQSLINTQTSFAFKRVSKKKKRGQQTDLYRSLITEVTVLSQKAVKSHNNISQLQGICWDCDDELREKSKSFEAADVDAQIWPVLVFERSQYGDLWHFAASHIGRCLTNPQRLAICIDIGVALTDMYENGEPLQMLLMTQLNVR
jgi:hypothetical protein